MWPDSPRPPTASITLISGGPGSGKSTVAKAIAKRLRRCLVINVDNLREMQVSGRSPPEGGWTPEVRQEFVRARATACFMAQRYAADGIDVIIDDVCVPAEFADHYAPLFAAAMVRKILLNPSGAALIERMRRRQNPWDRLLIEGIPQFLEQLSRMNLAGWTVIDSTNWSVDLTIDAVCRTMGPDVTPVPHPAESS